MAGSKSPNKKKISSAQRARQMRNRVFNSCFDPLYDVCENRAYKLSTSPSGTRLPMPRLLVSKHHSYVSPRRKSPGKKRSGSARKVNKWVSFVKHKAKGISGPIAPHMHAWGIEWRKKQAGGGSPKRKSPKRKSPAKRRSASKKKRSHKKRKSPKK